MKLMHVPPREMPNYDRRETPHADANGVFIALRLSVGSQSAPSHALTSPSLRCGAGLPSRAGSEPSGRPPSVPRQGCSRAERGTSQRGSSTCGSSRAACHAQANKRAQSVSENAVEDGAVQSSCGERNRVPVRFVFESAAWILAAAELPLLQPLPVVPLYRWVGRAASRLGARCSSAPRQLKDDPAPKNRPNSVQK